MKNVYLLQVQYDSVLNLLEIYILLTDSLKIYAYFF